MRYRGQGHEITVELPHAARSTGVGRRDAARSSTSAATPRCSAGTIPGLRIEIMSWTVRQVADRGHAAGEPGRRRSRADSVHGRSARGRCSTAAAAQDITDVPVYRRDRPDAGQRLAGPGRHRRGRDHDHHFGQFRRADRCRPASSSWTQGTHEEHSMSQSNSVGLIRPADDVEPPDRRRRGAGADPDAHRLQPDRRARRGDLSAGVFDLEGRMLAQAVTGTPGHVNSMAESVSHFLDKFPVDDHEAGRRLPHQRSVEGHRPSATTSSSSRRPSGAASWWRCSPAPATSSTSAAAASAPTRPQVYEEGLYIPMLKLVRPGQGRTRP